MSCTPKNPMVLLIIIPFLNGYFIGGIPHFQTYPNQKVNFESMFRSYVSLLEGTAKAPFHQTRDYGLDPSLHHHPDHHHFGDPYIFNLHDLPLVDGGWAVWRTLHCLNQVPISRTPTVSLGVSWVFHSISISWRSKSCFRNRAEYHSPGSGSFIIPDGDTNQKDWLKNRWNEFTSNKHADYTNMFLHVFTNFDFFFFPYNKITQDRDYREGQHLSLSVVQKTSGNWEDMFEIRNHQPEIGHCLHVHLSFPQACWWLQPMFGEFISTK